MGCPVLPRARAGTSACCRDPCGRGGGGGPTVSSLGLGLGSASEAAGRPSCPCQCLLWLQGVAVCVCVCGGGGTEPGVATKQAFRQPLILPTLSGFPPPPPGLGGSGGAEKTGCCHFLCDGVVVNLPIIILSARMSKALQALLVELCNDDQSGQG